MKRNIGFRSYNFCTDFSNLRFTWNIHIGNYIRPKEKISLFAPRGWRKKVSPGRPEFHFFAKYSCKLTYEFLDTRCWKINKSPLPLTPSPIPTSPHPNNSFHTLQWRLNSIYLISDVQTYWNRRNVKQLLTGVDGWHIITRDSQHLFTYVHKWINIFEAQRKKIPWQNYLRPGGPQNKIHPGALRKQTSFFFWPSKVCSII